MTIGDRLRELRQEAGLTQFDLAIKAGVKPASLSRWESGKVKKVSHDALQKLAAALGVDAALLAGPAGESQGDAYASGSAGGVESTESATADPGEIRRELIEGIAKLDPEGLSAMLGVLKVLARRGSKRAVKGQELLEN